MRVIVLITLIGCAHQSNNVCYEDTEGYTCCNEDGAVICRLMEEPNNSEGLYNPDDPASFQGFMPPVHQVYKVNRRN